MKQVLSGSVAPQAEGADMAAPAREKGQEDFGPGPRAAKGAVQEEKGRPDRLAPRPRFDELQRWLARLAQQPRGQFSPALMAVRVILERSDGSDHPRPGFSKEARAPLRGARSLLWI